MPFRNLAFLLLIVLEIALVHGVHVFPVYRLFQGEKSSQAFGSQSTHVNLLASKWAKQRGYSRTVSVAELKDFDLSDSVFNSTDAFLLLIPRNLNLLSKGVMDQWKQFEQIFLEKDIKIPVYFAWEDEDLSEIYNDLSPEVSTGSGLSGYYSQNYQFVATADPNPMVKDGISWNFQGWIRGPAGESTPTLAIVTHYDSFSIVPALSEGASSAGNLVALLEMSRIFSKLAQNPRTAPAYNLLFLATGGGPYNFAGLKHWLANSEMKVLEGIEFALCLDSLVSSPSLYFHISRQPKDEGVQKFFQGFSSSADSFSSSLSLVHKKVNVSSPDIDWAHEHFSKKRILSATITSLPSPVPLFSRSSLFDIQNLTDINLLSKNIKIVTEGLVKVLYNLTQVEGKETESEQKRIEIVKGTLDISPPFISSLFSSFCSTPRLSPYLNKKSPFLTSVGRLFSSYLTEVSNNSFSAETDWVFSSSIKGEISVYQVKPVSFDLLLAVSILGYLFLLSLILKGPTEFFNSLKKMFASVRKSTKGKK